MRGVFEQSVQQVSLRSRIPNQLSNDPGKRYPESQMLRKIRILALLMAVGSLPGGEALPDSNLGTPQDPEWRIRSVAADDGISKQRLAAVESLAHSGVARLKKWFPGTAARTITFVLHSDASSLSEEQRRNLQPGVPGFARLQRDEIHLVLAEIKIDPPNDLRTTVDHELVHILLDQHVGQHGLHVPRWFHEGLAQVLAGGLYLDIQEESLAGRVESRSYLPFSSLRESFPVDDPGALALAYGQSNSFVAFLRRRVGLEPLIAAARECSAAQPFYRVVGKRLGRGLKIYELEWCDYLKQSGAGYRVILRNCFMLTIVVFVGPLLAFAVARRRNREVAVKRRMAAQEREEELQAEMMKAAGEQLEADGWSEDGDEDEPRERDPDY